eukprot:168188-Pleurochrysis_carterae.AAC.1
MRKQLKEIKEVYAAQLECQQAREKLLEETKDAKVKAEESAAESDVSVKALAASKKAHAELKDSIGLNKGYASVPAPTFMGDASKEHATASWEKSSAKFVKASVGE